MEKLYLWLSQFIRWIRCRSISGSCDSSIFIHIRRIWLWSWLIVRFANRCWGIRFRISLCRFISDAAWLVLEKTVLFIHSMHAVSHGFCFVRSNLKCTCWVRDSRDGGCAVSRDTKVLEMCFLPFDVAVEVLGCGSRSRCRLRVVLLVLFSFALHSSSAGIDSTKQRSRNTASHRLHLIGICLWIWPMALSKNFNWPFAAVGRTNSAIFVEPLRMCNGKYVNFCWWGDNFWWISLRWFSSSVQICASLYYFKMYSIHVMK